MSNFVKGTHHNHDTLCRYNYSYKDTIELIYNWLIICLLANDSQSRIRLIMLINNQFDDKPRL